MAIRINNTTVIDDSRNFIGVALTATSIYADGTVGTAGSVLTSTGTGIVWATPTATGGGGSGTFDTGITTSIYVSVDSGIGIGVTDTNNIFTGPGIGYSFPSTAGKKYVIESIHIANIFGNELYLAARQDYSGGSNVPIAQRIIVPYQGSTELLEQPIIASPSDILRFQALDGAGVSANGVDGGLDAFIIISEKTDTDYIGTGATVTSTGGSDQTIFTSTTNPSTIQSIRLINYNLNIDLDARVSIYRGSVRLGYLVYDITVPKNSTIEILEKPKYLAASDSIRASSSTSDGLSVCISGKYIV
jgi:hypothetical protein